MQTDLTALIERVESDPVKQAREDTKAVFRGHRKAIRRAVFAALRAIQESRNDR